MLSSKKASTKKTSTSLRYLKARFKPLIKPIFLGSAGILGLFFLALWQYFKHPEWLRGSSEQEDIAAVSPQGSQDNPITSSELTIDELAALAEVDSLSSLFEEVNLNENLIPNALPATKSKSNPSNKFLEKLKPNLKGTNNKDLDTITTNIPKPSKSSQSFSKPDPIGYLPSLKDLRNRQRSSGNNALQKALERQNQPGSQSKSSINQGQNNLGNSSSINSGNPGRVTSPENSYLPNYNYNSGVNNYNYNNYSASGSLQANPYNYNNYSAPRSLQANPYNHVNQPQYYNNPLANPPLNNNYFQSVYPQYTNPSRRNNGLNNPQRNITGLNTPQRNTIPNTIPNSNPRLLNQPNYNGYGIFNQNLQTPNYQPNYNNGYGFLGNQTPPLTQQNQNQQNQGRTNYLYDDY